MWKCKECGNNVFEIHLDTTVPKVVVSKDGKNILKEENYGFTCCKCHIYGESIDEIANWMEKEK